MPHSFDSLMPRIQVIKKPGTAQRITSKKPFIQFLPAAKGAASNIPRQPEKLYTITSRAGIGSQVLLNLWRKWSIKIRFGRQGHETTGAQKLQDFHHAWIQGHK